MFILNSVPRRADSERYSNWRIGRIALCSREGTAHATPEPVKIFIVRQRLLEQRTSINDAMQTLTDCNARHKFWLDPH